jgi:hypothetical protein
MIKVNLKIQFVLFVVCQFFIGIGINEILTDGVKSGVEFLKQISPLIPFVASSYIFCNNIYSKKIDKK